MLQTPDLVCYNIIMSGREVIGRFAPTPSGFMHAGNILCAMLAYLSAKSKGGKFIIRIEDADITRCPRRAAADIIELLALFGIESDEPIIYQSERTEAYRAAEARLRRVAELYPCFCSRAELHAAGAIALPDGGVLYSQKCKSLSKAEAAARAEKDPPSVRLAVPDETIEFDDAIFGRQSQNLARECGDFVIRRRDGVYAYQLAVVVDDGYSGVTEIVRGADLLYDTPRQIYLQRLLGLPEPEYCHIPLVVTADGKKLSKSDGDSAARLLKQMTVQQITGALAHAAGITDEPRPTTLDELIPLFSTGKFSRSHIVLPKSFIV